MPPCVWFVKIAILFVRLLSGWSWKTNGSSDCGMNSRLPMQKRTDHFSSWLDDIFNWKETQFLNDTRLIAAISWNYFREALFSEQKQDHFQCLLEWLSNQTIYTHISKHWSNFSNLIVWWKSFLIPGRDAEIYYVWWKSFWIRRMVDECTSVTKKTTCKFVTKSFRKLFVHSTNRKCKFRGRFCFRSLIYLTVGMRQQEFLQLFHSILLLIDPGRLFIRWFVKYISYFFNSGNSVGALIFGRGATLHSFTTQDSWDRSVIICLVVLA